MELRATDVTGKVWFKVRSNNGQVVLVDSAPTYVATRAGVDEITVAAINALGGMTTSVTRLEVQ